MPRYFSISLVVAVAVATWANAPSWGDEPTQSPASDEFSGKVVTVYVGVGDEWGRGQVLENVEIKVIAGRQFLVGTGIDTGHPKNWTRGLRVGIAWDSVELYYVMTKQQADVLKLRKAEPEKTAEELKQSAAAEKRARRELQLERIKTTVMGLADSMPEENAPKK